MAPERTATLTSRLELIGPHGNEITPMSAMVAAFAHDPEVIRRRHARATNPRRSGSGRSDSLSLHFEDIVQFPLIGSAEEEQRLARVLRTGLQVWEDTQSTGIANLDTSAYSAIVAGVDAYYTFFESNTRLVITTARKFKKASITLEDAVSLGYLGLARAIEKFDPDKGFKFSTYATWWIKQSIQRGKSDNSPGIRIPPGVVSNINSIEQFCYDFLARYHRMPSDAEIRDEKLMSQDDLALALRARRSTTASLDTPVGPESDATLQDFLPDPNDSNDLVRIEDAIYIKHLLEFANLSKDEMILLDFNADDDSQLTIELSARDKAAYFGVSIRSIHTGISKARKKLLFARAISILSPQLNMSESETEDMIMFFNGTQWRDQKTRSLNERLLMAKKVFGLLLDSCEDRYKSAVLETIKQATTHIEKGVRKTAVRYFEKRYGLAGDPVPEISKQFKENFGDEDKIRNTDLMLLNKLAGIRT